MCNQLNKYIHVQLFFYVEEKICKENRIYKYYGFIYSTPKFLLVDECLSFNYLHIKKKDVNLQINDYYHL